jgi:hypothetical protein
MKNFKRYFFYCFFSLFFICDIFAQDATLDTKLVHQTIASLEKNLQISRESMRNNRYLFGKQATSLSVQNLETLEKLFKPLIDQLKKIKKDSQNSLQDIQENDKPQNTDNISNDTSRALQESKVAKESNEKVTSYIQQAEDFQNLKKEALEQDDWARAQDMENRNINAINKAIKELEKGNQGQKQNQDQQAQSQSKKSQDANDKLEQVQAYQEQIRKEREKIFGKKKNEVKKVPVDQDW